jgi:hypothetical protein
VNKTVQLSRLWFEVAVLAANRWKVCGKEEKMRGAPKVDVVMKVSDSLVREERCDLSQRELQFVRPIISFQRNFRNFRI